MRSHCRITQVYSVVKTSSAGHCTVQTWLRSGVGIEHTYVNAAQTGNISVYSKSATWKSQRIEGKDKSITASSPSGTPITHIDTQNSVTQLAIRQEIQSRADRITPGHEANETNSHVHDYDPHRSMLLHKAKLGNIATRLGGTLVSPPTNLERRSRHHEYAHQQTRLKNYVTS